MNNKTFDAVRKSVANTQTRPIPAKPASGYYVATSAVGSNASTTDIIRTDRKSA